METLKYTVIKTRKQYREYSDELECLVTEEKQTKTVQQEIELLHVLIEKWDATHNSFRGLDPVQLLEGLMEQRGMKAAALASLLGKSKGLISDILNYKKAMSKEMIRGLADEFKVSQEAFNRLYPLVSQFGNTEIHAKEGNVERRPMPKAVFMPKKEKATLILATREKPQKTHA
jgi:HTH-type transcriptional regulator/antitoxin HigA